VAVIKLAVLGVTSVLFLAPSVSAEQQKAGAGQTMVATINPVDTTQDRVANKISYGTAKFTQGSGKVDVLVQAAGVPVGGREAEPSADGGPATVGFNMRIVKSSDCATADQAPTVLAELPQLRVKADGSGILMASTDKVSLQQIAGQAVLIDLAAACFQRSLFPAGQALAHVTGLEAQQLTDILERIEIRLILVKNPFFRFNKKSLLLFARGK
jgi:hypothetical protein